ncbi:MAG TPA: prepilin-type N-terminal cleavage/methylation domain-containing protein [Gemmatimonadaceae bacterium]|jgi:prepilin-type N-terminal cleavage/methylation domain-containing protein
MTGASARRAGTTLVELLVVLAILATLAGVAALSVRRAPSTDPGDVWATIAAARRNAMRTGRETTVVVLRNGSPLSVALYPDGRTIADPALPIDPLTGRRIDAGH